MSLQFRTSRKANAGRITRRLPMLQQLESRLLLAADLPCPLPAPPPVGPAEEVRIDLTQVEFAPQTAPATRNTDIAITEMMEADSPLLPQPSEVDTGIKFTSGDSDPLKYYKPDLKSIVNGYSSGNAQGDQPVEDIDLKFIKIEFQYKTTGSPQQQNQQSGQGNLRDDIILPLGPLNESGEAFEYFTPEPKSADNGVDGNATDSPAPQQKGVGDVSSDPVGFLDENVAPVNIFSADDPDAQTEIDRAIQETGEELSRLYNRHHAPSLDRLPFINRLFQNRMCAPNRPELPLVTPRITIVQETQAVDKLVDVPVEDDNVQVDRLSVLQDLRAAAEQLLDALRQRLANIEGSETIGDVVASGPNPFTENLRRRIEMVEADLEFLNDPKVSLWARN